MTRSRRWVGALPYLAGICLAAATVLALDTRATPMRVTVRTPTLPAPPAKMVPNQHEAHRLGPDLPPGAPFPEQGTGAWRVVPGPTRPVGTGTVHSYAVEVEEGVVPPGGDRAFAAEVHHALMHPRGWTADGRFGFRRVDGEEPALRIRLAAQGTARATCGFDLPYDTSCRVGSTVYLSAPRWFRGAHAYGGDLTGYRAYVVNHEVGHFLGLAHEPCPVDGGPAPVMMQQTLSTANDELARITAGSDQGGAVAADGKTCRPNPWPHPAG